MAEIDQEKAVRTVDQVLGLLVNGDYRSIVEMSNGRGLQTKDLEDRVKWWKIPFAKPPALSFDKLNVIPMVAAGQPEPARWAIDVDLWCPDLSARSDLTALLELTESSGEYYAASVRDVRVM